MFPLFYLPDVPFGTFFEDFTVFISLAIYMTAVKGTMNFIVPNSDGIFTVLIDVFWRMNEIRYDHSMIASRQDGFFVQIANLGDRKIRRDIDEIIPARDEYSF